MQVYIIRYINYYYFVRYLAVNQFKEEEYISCVTQEPLMSTSYYAYRMFDRMLDCHYSPSTLEQRCRYVLPRFLLFYLC